MKTDNDRDRVITRLKVMHTWVTVEINRRHITVDDCKKMLVWLDEAIKYIEGSEKIETRNC